MSLTATTFIAEGSFHLLPSESLAVCIGVAPPALLFSQASREGLQHLASVPLSLPSGMVASYRYAVVCEGRVLVRALAAAAPPPPAREHARAPATPVLLPASRPPPPPPPPLALSPSFFF
jgi:hypothetical protein